VIGPRALASTNALRKKICLDKSPHGEQLLQNGGEAIIDNRLICTVRPGNDAMTTNQTRFHEGWKNESGSLKSNMSKEKGQFKISVR